MHEEDHLSAGCSINFLLHLFSSAENNSGDGSSSAYFSSASLSCISFEQQMEGTKSRRLEATVANFENWTSNVEIRWSSSGIVPVCCNSLVGMMLLDYFCVVAFKQCLAC